MLNIKLTAVSSTQCMKDMRKYSSQSKAEMRTLLVELQ